MPKDSEMIISIILVLAIAQGLMMSLALITGKRGPVIANRCLAFLLLSMIMGLSGHLIELLGIQSRLQAWYFFSTGTIFLFGPFLYLYVKFLLDEKFNINSINSSGQ